MRIVAKVMLFSDVLLQIETRTKQRATVFTAIAIAGNAIVIIETEFWHKSFIAFIIQILNFISAAGVLHDFLGSFRFAMMPRACCSAC